MKIVTNKYGKVFIRWQYNITDGDRDITKAFLEKHSEDNKEKEVIKEISVYRHPKEKYDKLVAREFALAKLVRESFTRKDSDLIDRALVWNTYNLSVKRKRK